MNPKVSILIPTYNHGHLISRCLSSVLEQSYENKEVIVIDNHSTDSTQFVIKSFKNKLDIKYYLIDNEGIIAKSRNLGIQKSTGTFVAFLDSDDWWTPDKLETSVKYLENGADLVYHDLTLYGLQGIPFIFNKAKARNLNSPVIKDLLLRGNGINNSSVVVRKSIIDKVGFLSEEKAFIAGEDFDYWIRIAKITNKFKKIPKCLGYYWVGGGNTSNPANAIRINSTIFEKYRNEIRFYSADSINMPSWMIYSNISSGIDLGKVSLMQLAKSIRLIGTYKFLRLLTKYFLKRANWKI